MTDPLLTSEDGSDPRRFHDRRGLHDRPGQKGQPGRKAQQLAAQVADALSLILASAADERLQALAVVDVVPAPTSARLLVTVRGDPDALAVLEASAGWLRTQVAGSIHRRYTPELVFRAMA